MIVRGSLNYEITCIPPKIKPVVQAKMCLFSDIFEKLLRNTNSSIQGARKITIGTRVSGDCLIN